MSAKRDGRDALDTRVVVVSDADGKRGADIARALAGLDAAIVLAGADTDALAALASELGATGARFAVLVDDVATDRGRAALVEMVNELFPRRNT
jgi:NADP-dependent 3-hydroxy acid dehydrogenase YdfG